jgi:hypothetical protein
MENFKTLLHTFGGNACQKPALLLADYAVFGDIPTTENVRHIDGELFKDGDEIRCDSCENKVQIYLTHVEG